MRRHPRPGRRRWAVTGLTAAGLLASLTTGIAQADDGQDPIPVTITGPDRHDLAVGGDYPVDGMPSFEIGLSAPGAPDMEGNAAAIHQGDFTVTIDASRLAGVADVKLPCDADGLVATCTGSELYAGAVHNGDWDVRVRAADGARAGATGSLSVTGAGEGLTFTERTVQVRVGSPEFEMLRPSEPEGFAAGDVLDAQVGFHNVGTLAADGVTLRFAGSRGLSFPQEFGNCWYGVENENDFMRMRRIAYCFFADDDVAPNEAYRTVGPVKVETADFALYDIFHYRVAEYDPSKKAELRNDGYQRGTGDPLTLEKVQADAGDYSRHSALDFPTGNTHDLDLTGDRVKGAAGETVTVDVALHNRGPAWIGNLRVGGGGVDFKVAVPDGATVVKAPAACEEDEREGGRVVGYWCVAGAPLLEEDTREFAFEMRIDEVVEGAKSLVEFVHGPLRSEAKPSNDDGWIVLNGTGDEETPGDTGGSDGSGDDTDGSDDASGDDGSSDDDASADGGSTGGSDEAGTATGTDTDGGSLALTGTGAMTLAGVALALLAAGGALLVVRRRRAALASTDDAAV